MNYIDYIVLAAVIIGFILGFKEGFVRKLIGIIGFIIAIILGVMLSKSTGKFIEAVFGIEYYLAEIMGGVAVFVAIMIVTTILKRLIHPFDKVNNLINQLVGGFVGVIQLLFFISALLLLLNVFNFPDKKEKKSSVFYNMAYEVIPTTINLFKNYTPKPENVIKDYINQKDTLK